MQPPSLIMIEMWWWILLRFSKTREFWSSKGNSHLHFLLPSIILLDLLRNRSLLQWIQKVMVCNLWLVDFDPFCVSLCTFQGWLLVIVIVTDSSEKRNCKGNFWTSEFMRFFKKSSVPDERYFSQWHRQLRTQNLGTPNRSQSYDLLVRSTYRTL